ncbi:MAG: 4-(cytidine 5'-diphospho)-2-C-methyl-D-erythritol kinase, partial [Elusimicrobiota bacterium]
MSGASIQVLCPAKVNLFLEVTGRRQDGYHLLATLFAKINLHDVLDLSPAPGFSLEVVSDRGMTRGSAASEDLGAAETGQELSAGPDNLVLRAAKAFAAEFRTGGGAAMRLTKRIPRGAGLGGGSSDAAGALLGLVKLHRVETPGTLARLRRLALGLGADVPLFLHPATLCEGRGIGERLRSVPAAKSLPYMVLVYPDVPVATKGVFAALERPSRKAVLTSLSRLGTLEKKLGKGSPISEWEPLLFNRLESGVAADHPEVAQARNILLRLGLRGVLMSGSGSAVYGFAASHLEGEQALKR